MSGGKEKNFENTICRKEKQMAKKKKAAKKKKVAKKKKRR
jgi:hypothetical protein